MSDQKQSILTFDWALVFYWMMATTSGWLLGWLLFPAIALVTAGVGAGIMQCLVLYRRIPRAWQWIVATAIGWLAGLAIIIPIVPAGFGFLSGAVLGAATGTAQWLLLRRSVYWAGWWILVSALAWATGLSLAPPSELVVLPRIVLSGVMPAFMIGIVLVLLMQYPKPSEEEETENG
jgi:hypothetical protein